MNWIPLENTEQLLDIRQKSNFRPQVIFKHSTSCPLSAIAKTRLEDVCYRDDLDLYYLDLLTYRSVSQAVAEEFDVHHESPQVILIWKEVVIYDDSHLDITASELIEQLPTI